MNWRLGGSTIGGAAAVSMVLLVLFAGTASAQRGAARPKVDRPDGDVWQVIRQNCTQCHGIDDYAFYALDRAGWGDLLDSKHADFEEVSLSDDDRSVLLDYLVAEFGADSTPFPRRYIPPEITVFFTDPEAFRLMERACTSCHSMDRVDEARFSLDGWRVVLVNMREQGAIITDEELEKLTEWLSRTRGINPVE